MSSDETVVGVIDVGSNTIHLAVVGVSAEGRLRYLTDETELVRLGEDVSASGRIGPERMERAVAVISSQARRALECHVEAVLGIATEGVRAAANGDELFERVECECGLHLRLITGEQEAALTYWGATWPWATAPERQAVLDLGGGSLEIVVGERRRVMWRVSLPLGSGAVYGRHVHSDPPPVEELDAVAAETRDMLASVAPPLPVARVVACGGTATTLLRLAAMRLAPSSALTGETLTVGALDNALALLRQQPTEALQAATGIDQTRLRLLGPGAVVLRGALEWLGGWPSSLDAISREEKGSLACYVSLAGVREGAALAFVQTRERWPELAAIGKGW